MSHGDSIVRPPEGFSVTAATARTSRSPPSRTRDARIYGVQFHPEVVHTARGQEMLKRFLYERRAAAGRPGRTPR